MGTEEYFGVVSYARIIQKMVKLVLQSLANRHGMNINYVVQPRVGKEFQECLEIATTAFLERLLKKPPPDKDLNKLRDLIRSYFESRVVAQEVSKLLDPGLEVFDSEVVIRELEKKIHKLQLTGFKRPLICLAWEEFERAFSFASRSAPRLREFLRASYEAGSFKVLTNIGDVLEKLDEQVSLFADEEEKLKGSLQLYSSELYGYRKWLKEFEGRLI